MNKKDLDDWLREHKRSYKTILPTSNTKTDNMIGLLTKINNILSNILLSIPFLLMAGIFVGFAFLAPPEIILATIAILGAVFIGFFISGA